MRRAGAIARTLAATALGSLAVAAAPTPAGAQDTRALAPHAKASILVEASTGRVVHAEDAAAPRAIASTTKLMTALLALESAALGDVMTAARYDAAPVESVLGLRAGERLSVADLLRALLLQSANDAAVTLAVRIAGSRRAFVERMNERARTLGLRETRFANPIGLDDPDNRSSARDLVTLTRALRGWEFFRQVTNRRSATLRTGSRRRTIVNRNRLVRTVPWVDGVKTGRTSEAGYVLVGSGTRNGVTMLSVVLGTPSEAARDADSLALLRFGTSAFRRVPLVRRGARLGSAGLAWREERVALVAGRTLRRVLPRGTRARVRILDAPEELDGPLERGEPVATALVSAEGRAVGRVPVVVARRVQAAGIADRLGGASTLLLIGAAAAAAVGAVAAARRRSAR